MGSEGRRDKSEKVVTKLDHVKAEILLKRKLMQNAIEETWRSTQTPEEGNSWNEAAIVAMQILTKAGIGTKLPNRI